MARKSAVSGFVNRSFRSVLNSLQEHAYPRRTSCCVDHGEVDEPDAIRTPFRLARERIDRNRRAVDEPAEGRRTSSETHGEGSASTAAEAEIDPRAVGREGDLRSTADVESSAGVEAPKGCRQLRRRDCQRGARRRREGRGVG